MGIIKNVGLKTWFVLQKNEGWARKLVGIAPFKNNNAKIYFNARARKKMGVAETHILEGASLKP